MSVAAFGNADLPVHIHFTSSLSTNGSARDGNATPGVHQHAEQVGTLDDDQLAPPCFHEFRVVVRHGPGQHNAGGIAQV